MMPRLEERTAKYWYGGGDSTPHTFEGCERVRLLSRTEWEGDPKRSSSWSRTETWLVRVPDEPRWIVQDVFSSGTPSPAFTVHEDREEAEIEAVARNGAVIPYRQCENCESILGLENRPLQTGCSECR